MVGEWDLARVSPRPGHRTQELDASAAWLGPCLSIRKHPRVSENSVKVGHRVDPSASPSTGVLAAQGQGGGGD